MKTGKVYLVGAGPSDAGLLTVKGKSLLEQADVAVYDALAGKAVLSEIPSHVEKIYAGKRFGSHSMPQEEISRLLVKLAREGKTVVRLKGGDSFLFGRGGEELELLKQEKIPFEVVPGVSSALAVPAYFGIPLTHRDYSSSVHILTAHKKEGALPAINFRALYESGGTFVFLMGARAVKEICQGFLEAGMPAGTPAALLSKGTIAAQKGVTGNLTDMIKRAETEKTETPAVLVIGEVCGLAGKLRWREALPLSGKRILTTRPEGRSKALAERLRLLGAEVLEVPTIETVCRTQYAPLLAELERIEEYSYLVFTSPFGVQCFFEILKKEKKDIRSIGRIKLGAIGGATAGELESRGLIPSLIPEKYDGKSLGEALVKRLQDKEKVLLVRAADGGRELPETLAAAKEKYGKQIAVTDIPVYDTVIVKNPALALAPLFQEEPQPITVFTSSSTVRGFYSLTGGQVDYTGVRAACIGRKTWEEAKKAGMQCYMAKQADEESLLELILQMADCHEK